MTRIRIIYKEKRPSFAELLERRARNILKRAKRKERGVTVSSTLERELALTLSHLDSVRHLHQDLRRNLLRHECYLGTELAQREPREPIYLDPRLPERDRLRDRLRDIDKERRRLAVTENEALRGLHDRLLGVMNKHTLFDQNRVGPYLDQLLP